MTNPEALSKELAAAQAREAKLGDALSECGEQLRLTNTNLYKGMSRSIQRMQATDNRDALTSYHKALALPQDTSALEVMITNAVAEYQQRLSAALALLGAETQIDAEINLQAMIKQAGEVMRERCAAELSRLDYWYSRDAIRALPGVTTGELK